MMTSCSDGIEASELKRPLTPLPESNFSTPKRGRPRKAPSRCYLPCGDNNLDEKEASLYGEIWRTPYAVLRFSPGIRGYRNRPVHRNDAFVPSRSSLFKVTLILVMYWCFTLKNNTFIDFWQIFLIQIFVFYLHLSTLKVVDK